MIAIGGVGKGISGAVRYAMGEGNDPVTEKRRPAAANDDESRVAWVSGQGWEEGWKPENRQDVEFARRLMERMALQQKSKTKPCEKDCLHLVLSWRKGENPDRDEMEQAARGALAAVGMEKARAVFVAHDDKDHMHLHIVASRINPETRTTFRDSYSNLKWQKWALQWEREHGQVQCPQREKNTQLQAAIEGHNAATVLELMTQHQSTFTGNDLDRALFRYANKKTAAELKSEILAQADVLQLYDRENGQELDRFTTHGIREAEHSAIEHAGSLENNQHHKISKGAEAAALSKRQTIREEQRDAFDHATGAEGLAIIDGKAGTGKSYTIGAIRDAYEIDGKRVIGLAPTNAVAQDMERDGFKEGKTVHSALFALKNDRDQWNEKTVIIVDEAAMMDTKIMNELASRADAAKAKLILVGDDRQLASVDRGGLFTELRQRHGASELSEVTRQRDEGHKATSEMLARGEFGEAVDALNKLGCITRNNHQDESREALVEQWGKDTANAPARSRFVFAYTNDDVKQLNAELRAVRQGRGELGEDREFTTKDGKAKFAEGDRLMFTKTDRKQGQIVENGRVVSRNRQGITNGAMGTIERIEGQFITLKLDGKSDRRLTFNAEQFDGFRHGYAGTIYKGQGRTFDDVYLYHSAHWRDKSAYVALTRHRDNVKLFVSTEVTRDDADLARQMGRHDDRRASVAFATKEEATKQRSERLTRTVQEITARRQHDEKQQSEPTKDRMPLTLDIGHDEGIATPPVASKPMSEGGQASSTPAHKQDGVSSRVLRSLVRATESFLKLFDVRKQEQPVDQRVPVTQVERIEETELKLGHFQKAESHLVIENKDDLCSNQSETKEVKNEPETADDRQGISQDSRSASWGTSIAGVRGNVPDFGGRGVVRGDGQGTADAGRSIGADYSVLSRETASEGYGSNLISDPYVYSGTHVLKNKEDIRDYDDLHVFERMKTTSRMETLPDDLPITKDGYRAIHRYIFQDVYDWAGEVRTVDIAKNNSLFCHPPFIDKELDKRFKEINAENNLRGTKREDFADRAAYHLSELNAIHPFREGNGRTQRSFLVILGQQAGHQVDLQHIDPEEWNKASRDSFHHGDYSLLRKIISDTLSGKQPEQTAEQEQVKVEPVRNYAESKTVRSSQMQRSEAALERLTQITGELDISVTTMPTRPREMRSASDGMKSKLDPTGRSAPMLQKTSGQESERVHDKTGDHPMSILGMMLAAAVEPDLVEEAGKSIRETVSEVAKVATPQFQTYREQAAAQKQEHQQRAPVQAAPALQTGKAAAQTVFGAAGKAVDGAVGGVAKVADGAVKALDSVLDLFAGGTPSPKQADKSERTPPARQDNQAPVQTQSAGTKREEQQPEKPLSPDDLAIATSDDMRNITDKAKLDARLEAILREREDRETARRWKDRGKGGGRERER